MKSRILAFLLLLFIFAACPPPDYPILFGYNGEWHKSLKIEEASIRLKIRGEIRLSGWSDVLFIKVGIEGLDNSKITFFDTTNFSGRSVSRTHYFDNKIIFQSETFRSPAKFDSHLERDLDIFLERQKVDIVISAIFDNHELYEDMTRGEFFSYLDKLTARIRIENLFAEPKLINVKVDKKLLAKKLRGWVPALEENG